MQQKKISSVLADAYSDSLEPKPTAIGLWGVTIDPNGMKDAKASVVLMKFLRARHVPVLHIYIYESSSGLTRPRVRFIYANTPHLKHNSGISTQPRPQKC
jgi:hypothetical protein